MVVEIVVVELLLLPVAAELLVDVFGVAVEFVSMEMLVFMIVELLCPPPNEKREFLTGGTLVVVAIVVAVLLLLLAAAELLVEVFGAAVEFVSIEILASIIVEWLCPAPNVKREPLSTTDILKVPLMRKIVSQKIRVIVTTCGLNYSLVT